MTQADYEPFCRLLKEAAEYFRDTQPLTDARIAIYWESLSGYDFDRIVKAMGSLYASRKYDGLPKAGDIREVMTPAWREPDKEPPLTWAECEGNSAKARFLRYLLLTGKWKELGDRWAAMFAEWKAAGQPMPNNVQKRSILKSMEGQ